MVHAAHAVPNWHLYGETRLFPDMLHVERIADRAAPLGWRIAPHRHLHLHQLFLFTAGRIRMTVDGSPQAAEPPALVNLPPDSVHGFDFSPGTGGFVVSLPVTHFPALFDPGSETAAPVGAAFVARAPEGAGALFAEIAAAHAMAGAPFRRTRLAALAALVLAQVAALRPGAAAGPAADPRIIRFEAQIDRHLRDGWTLAEHARALATSPRHLSRLCRAARGLSAQALVERHRLREACRLLAYTRLPVALVGEAVGLPDPAYFSRAFRRATGLAPRDYRARLNG